MRVAVFTVISIFFILTAESGFAQKVKYKDLFPILDSKNYAQGEPMLRAFLADPKNEAAPNANLQMAYILEMRADKLNVISDSTALMKTADSAAIAFQKAKILITSKELKKNDEYYQSFYRRDLRTGEFGIKLTDVQLELDTKIEKFRLVSKKTAELAGALPKLEKVYSESNKLYTSFTEKFESVNELALSTNELIKADLKVLIDNGDEIEFLVDKIQDIVAEHPKADYNANIEVNSIENFSEDGVSGFNIYEGNYKFWDYKGFAKDLLQSVDGEIGEFKMALIEQDKDFLNKLAVVERAETLMRAPVISDELQTQIQKFDPEGLPANVLRFRALEIAFKNIELVDEDSAYVTKQLRKVDTLYSIINQLETIFSKINARNTEKEKQKYLEYVKAIFNRSTQVNKYVSEKETWLLNRKNLLDQSFEYWSEINKWGVGEDFRIPLFTPETLEGYEWNYLSKMVEEQDDYSMNCFGYILNESPYKGYVARVSSSRQIDWIDQFDLKSTSAEALTTSYDYNILPSEDDRFTFSLGYEDGINPPTYRYFCYQKEGGKIWDHEFEFEASPFNVKFNDLTKETIIYLNDPDNIPNGEELKYIVIDRAGKVRK